MTEQPQTVKAKTKDLSGEALEWAIGFAEFFQKALIKENCESPNVWDAEKMLSVMKDYCIGVFEDEGKWFASPSLEIVSLMEGPNNGEMKEKPYREWLQCNNPFLFEGESMEEAVKRCYIGIIYPCDYFEVPVEFLEVMK